ncbi:MAG TPA: type II toxin-antitoxin system prevent-host-death family antitoxin, partial [Bryobacterales bacterium]|nr:type II toxin-antitoxin system prevent-host-death family antitoxin [Bryobacterales bacterium]
GSYWRRGDRVVKTVEMDKATRSLADCAREAGQEPLVVTDHGKPVAVLLPLENTDLETASLSSNPRFIQLIERSRSRVWQEGSVSSAEVRRRLGLS